MLCKYKSKDIFSIYKINDCVCVCVYAYHATTTYNAHFILHVVISVSQAVVSALSRQHVV